MYQDVYLFHYFYVCTWYVHINSHSVMCSKSFLTGFYPKLFNLSIYIMAFVLKYMYETGHLSHRLLINNKKRLKFGVLETKSDSILNFVCWNKFFNLIMGCFWTNMKISNSIFHKMEMFCFRASYLFLNVNETFKQNLRFRHSLEKTWMGHW